MYMKAIVAVGILLAATRGEACAPMSEGNSGVQVTEESAVIVWDAKNKTQHFIRRAQFDGKGKSLGFVVPTPSVPKLAKADVAVFGQLETLIAPEVVYKTQVVRRYTSIFSGFSQSEEVVPASELEAAFATDSAAPEPVEVINSQRVGRYDATILRARNASALGRWLNKNGYSSNAAFDKWLDFYVQKRWYITAFKVAKTDADEPLFVLPPVRMSFQTPRPFYPYREPQQPTATTAKNTSASKRSLRVFFFAPNRMQAVPGTFKASREWPGKVEWADVADKHRLDWPSVAQELNLSEQKLRDSGRLTVFEDFSSPRPGTDDVFFEATENKQTLPEPAVITRKVDKPVYIDLILLAGGTVVGLAVFGVRRWQR